MACSCKLGTAGESILSRDNGPGTRALLPRDVTMRENSIFAMWRVGPPRLKN